MIKVFTRARFLLAAAALAGTIGCDSDSVTATTLEDLESSGSVELRLRNTGSAPLTNVSVLVAEGATPIVQTVLQPGQTTTYVARTKAHENPLVTLQVDGRNYVSNPVEGFSGFNSTLADGRYTISMEPVVVEGYHSLYVRVTKDN